MPKDTPTQSSQSNLSSAVIKLAVLAVIVAAGFFVIADIPFIAAFPYRLSWEGTTPRVTAEQVASAPIDDTGQVELSARDLAEPRRVGMIEAGGFRLYMPPEWLTQVLTDEPDIYQARLYPFGKVQNDLYLDLFSGPNAAENIQEITADITEMTTNEQGVIYEYREGRNVQGTKMVLEATFQRQQPFILQFYGSEQNLANMKVGFDQIVNGVQ